MSLSDAAENAICKLLFNNTTWANYGDATGLVGSGGAGNLYVSLHTADPTEGGTQASSETSYTSYARVAVARTSGGWTVGATPSSTVSNTAATTFPTCTGGPATVTHVGLGTASSGTGILLSSVPLSASLSVTASPAITPNFPIGTLTFALD